MTTRGVIVGGGGRACPMIIVRSLVFAHIPIAYYHIVCVCIHIRLNRTRIAAKIPPATCGLSPRHMSNYYSVLSGLIKTRGRGVKKSRAAAVPEHPKCFAFNLNSAYCFLIGQTYDHHSSFSEVAHF